MVALSSRGIETKNIIKLIIKNKDKIREVIR